MSELFTNAPAHWPKVRLEGFAPDPSPDMAAAHRLRFAAALETTFRGSSAQVLEADVIRVTPEGVVAVPLRVRDQAEDFDLFFYPVPDGKAAAHFVALDELGRKGRLRPVYYSTDDLLAVYPDAVEPVAQRDRLFVQAALAPQKGQYAMWWPKNQGEMFHYSPTFDLYDRIYRETSGAEAEAFGLILLELGMVEDLEEFTSTKFSQSALEIPLEGPEGVPMVASFSRERGVRFHFHLDRTPHEYRDLFLNLYLLRLREWTKTRAPSRKTMTDSPPYVWWRELGRRLRAQTGESAISAVGSVKR